MRQGRLPQPKLGWRLARVLRLSRQEGRCLRSEAEGEGGPLGQLQCAAVCECMRVCALSSDSSSAPTPHPSMTSHFLGCLCMGCGGGSREGEETGASVPEPPSWEEKQRWGGGGAETWNL